MSVGFEAMLLRWSETSNGGATIVLQLADPSDLEHFKLMTLAKKPTKNGEGMAGQRLMVGVAEIGEDEKPVDSQWTEEERAAMQSQGKPPLEINRIPKGGPLARLAGIWCAEPLFHRWLNTVHAGDWNASFLEPPARAAEIVRKWCEVDSRADLDNDSGARELFDRFVRIPYAEYRAQHGAQQESE